MRELLARDGYRSASLEEVARVADVTRATVYYQFGSKAGLLEAVIGDIQRRAGQPAVADAVGVTDPIEALRQAFVVGCRFWAAEHPLIRRLTGLAAVDEEISRVIANVEQMRVPLLAGLVERLEAAGHLAPDVPAPRALDVLWMLSSFEAFDQLLTGRGLTVQEIAEILTDLAVRGLTTQHRHG